MMGDKTARRAAPLALLLLFAGESSGRTRGSFGDLKVGQTVTVEGQPSGPRTLLARKIKVYKGTREDKLKGRVQDIDGTDNSLTLLGVRVVAARDARVEDREGSPTRFSSLRKGWMVKVKGRLRDDGVVEAAEIKVSKGKDADEAEVGSRVQAIDHARSTLTVLGLTVRVTSGSEIKFD